MTVITKLSDHDNLLSKAVMMLLKNVGTLNPKKLQFELFNRGIYVEDVLLKQCVSVLKEKGFIIEPKKDVEPVQEKS